VEFDTERRLDLIHAVLHEYTREVPVIPLYYRSEVSVTPANLAGYKLPGHQVAATNHVERWNLLAPGAGGDRDDLVAEASAR
jgi:peptide/nickel transport system substrate-binding protein